MLIEKLRHTSSTAIRTKWKLAKAFGCRRVFGIDCSSEEKRRRRFQTNFLFLQLSTRRCQMALGSARTEVRRHHRGRNGSRQSRWTNDRSELVSTFSSLDDSNHCFSHRFSLQSSSRRAESVSEGAEDRPTNVPFSLQIPRPRSRADRLSVDVASPVGSRVSSMVAGVSRRCSARERLVPRQERGK